MTRFLMIIGATLALSACQTGDGYGTAQPAPEFENASDY